MTKHSGTDPELIAKYFAFCRVVLFFGTGRLFITEGAKLVVRPNKRIELERGNTGPMVTRWLSITSAEEDDRAIADRRMGSGESSGSMTPRESPGSARKTTPGRETQEILTFRASIESKDRAGDVIRADGWELDSYRRNPVILWTHRHDLLPVGRSLEVWVERDSLMATVEFAPTEFGQQVKRLFQEGFLSGVSVGFRALKTSPAVGSGQLGTVFEQQELLEISAAPVPMHPEALSTGRGQGGTERELIPLFRELTEIWRLVASGVSESSQ